MRRRVHCFIIIFLIQVGNKLNAQIKKEDKFNIEIKAPDASHLSKFVDIPASTHTGAVAIDIPIFNIKCDDFNLPISLKYHTSGVKMKEVASKVGLGWSLSIGGISLNKQIIGNEDKGYIPYINQMDGAYTPNDRTSNDHPFTVGILGFDILNPNEILFGSKKDTQPDIFSYSVGNSSGDFYIDTSGKPIKLGETSVKIVAYPFVLTNDVGNKFYFSAASKMKTVGGSIPSVENLVVTDFKIDKIVLKNGKEINFEYETIPSYRYLSSYYKGFSYPISCQPSVDQVDPNVEYNEYASLTEVFEEKYLKKIIYPEGFITFTYANTREDMTNGLSLTNISANNISGVVANYQLNKNYFTTSDVKNINGYANETDKLTKRLKLNEVKNLLDNTKYQLNYHEENPLPNRLSDATDYVGFYNGIMNNQGIPYVAIGDIVYGWGDNKNPNIDFAVSGSLKEISYPPGGKMKIEYELDDFDYDSYLPETLVSQKEETMTSGDLESTISVNSDATTIMFKVNFSSTANLDNDGSGTLPLANSSYFIAEIRDVNNVVLKSFLLNGNYDFFLDKKPNYKLRIIKNGNPSIDKVANYSVKWYEITHVPSIRHNKSVGGIRVKRVTKEDNQSIPLEDRFIYKDINNRSTGVFMGDPLNYYYFNLSPLGYLGESCNNLIISNSGNFNLSTINGKPTVYNKVITETINSINPNENYRITDTYLNSTSTNYYNSSSSFQTFINNQYSRGILQKKEFFDFNNSLQKKIEYDYFDDHYYNTRSSDYLSLFPFLTIRPYQIKIIKITKERDMMSAGPKFFYIPTFEFTRYDMTSGWIKLNFQKSTTYLGNNNLVETTNYFYNSNHDHLNPVRSSYLISTGDITETNYSYAHEKSNQYLINKNMVGMPLETIVAKKENINDSGKIISQTETKYPTSQAQADIKTSGFALPYEVWSKDLQSNLKTELTYDRYDTKGNLLQYTTKDGIPTSIIWGYNQTQPIAKVEGALLSNIPQSLIAAIVSASDADASNSSNEPALIDALDAFRKDSGLAGYQITTYSYNPLIGVTSITPPSGIKEVYLYDSANRLKEIREENATGKILKEFKYNYKP